MIVHCIYAGISAMLDEALHYNIREMNMNGNSLMEMLKSFFSYFDLTYFYVIYTYEMKPLLECQRLPLSLNFIS